MKKIILVIAAFAVGFFGFKFFYNKSKEQTAETVVEKTEEQESEWISLFDGKTFDGWHNYKADGVSSEWTVEDGAMVFRPNPAVEGVGDIVTDKEFTSFKLSIDWKISEGGNSGIFWGVHEGGDFRVPYQTGPEIQVLDDERHPDRKLPSHRAGCLYDMLALNVPAVHPAGEWNTCIIEINHNTNKGNVWLNDKLVVTFPVHGEEWDAMVAKSKFKDWKGFGIYQTGRIGLQDHGDIVSYRNIKIKEL